MPIIPTGYAQLNNVMALTGDSEHMLVTMGIRFDDPAPGNMLAVVNTCFNAFKSSFDDMVCTNYTFLRTDMYVGATGGSMVYSSNVAPSLGLSSPNSVPQNTAWLVKKLTATAGRTGRGRMYIPGVAESQVQGNGELVSGVQEALQDAANDYRDALIATDGVASPVLLHAAVGDLPMDIIALVADSRVATQRRRMR